MGVLVDGVADAGQAGEIAAVGSLVCVGCGYSISLSAGDELPECPACGAEMVEERRFPGRTSARRAERRDQPIAATTASGASSIRK